MSGYTHCACRDCFEITIGDDDALCRECEESGCEANAETECDAPHAYGQHCGNVECCDEEELQS
jgi:hypothetical protein